MDNTILTIILTLIGSSGVWAIILYKIQRKDKQKDDDKLNLENTIKELQEKLIELETNLLTMSNICLGLAYDRAKHVAMQYINKGSITAEEYANFVKYLYQPYADAGGDGEVEDLKNILFEMVSKN